VDTASVAVIASSTVAVAAIGAGWLQHRGSLKHQRKLADLGNVRDVLDDAAALLHRVAYVLDDVRLALTQYEGGFFRAESRVETYRKLERCGQECDALRERLAVRLGRRHEAVKTFAEADEAVLTIYRALGVIKLEVDPPPDPSAAKQVATIVNAKRDEITEQGVVFDERRVDFMAAAHGTAGAELPA